MDQGDWNPFPKKHRIICPSGMICNLLAKRNFRPPFADFLCSLHLSIKTATTLIDIHSRQTKAVKVSAFTDDYVKLNFIHKVSVVVCVLPEEKKKTLVATNFDESINLWNKQKCAKSLPRLTFLERVTFKYYSIRPCEIWHLVHDGFNCVSYCWLVDNVSQRSTGATRY